MEKLHWGKYEFIAFLEDLVKDNKATEDEIEFYESLIWDGRLDKESYFYTYKKLMKKIKREYER